MKVHLKQILWPVLCMGCICAGLLLNAPETVRAEDNGEPTTQTDPTDPTDPDVEELPSGLVRKDNQQIMYYDPQTHQPVKSRLMKITENGTAYYFYFDRNGYAYRNGLHRLTVSGVVRYYYFLPNGHAFTGGLRTIQASDGNKYYYCFDSKGRAYTSRLRKLVIKGKAYYYYFKANGRAVTNRIYPVVRSGKKYYHYFNQYGRALTSKWKTVGKKRYYFDKYGRALVGRKKINKNYYFFNSKGVCQTGWHKTGKKWYYYDTKKYKQKFANNDLHTAAKRIAKKESETDYYIVIDTDHCWLFVFKGKAGDWKPIRCWRCSPGKPSTPTVLGYYKVGIKGYSFGRGFSCYYYTQILGNYLIHSGTYRQGTRTLLDGRIGVKISHGCVRLDIDHAKWIYDTIPTRTQIYIYDE